MQFALRAYIPEDFQTLWEIDQSCFAPEIAYSQFELKTYIRRSAAFTFVAEEISPDVRVPAQAKSVRVLGFVVGEHSSRGRGHIITIDVRERGRRQGVGSALLEAAEVKFRERNCPSIRLETAVDNIAALSFYKRQGYNVVRTIPRYYSNGLDALLLEKILVSVTHPASDKHLH